MTRRHFFTTCAECGKEGLTRIGVCDGCAVKYGYVEQPFVDDVDPASRDPAESLRPAHRHFAFAHRMAFVQSRMGPQ